MKRLALLFLLLACSIGLFAQTASLFTAGFEDGTAGAWHNRGSAALSATTGAAHTGKYSLLTTGRSAGWNGPEIDLTGKVVLSGGYHVSVWAMIKQGDPDSDLIVTAQRTKSGTQAWDRIAQAPGKAGAWVNLQGDYSPTQDFDSITIYVESSNATIAYYIDDFSVTQTKAPATAQLLPSLADAYKANFVIGTAVEPSDLTGPLGDVIKTQYSGLVAENAMKPQYLAPSENTYDFTNADAIADYAAKNGKLLRGHTLVWHQQNAQWMFYDSKGNVVSKDVLLKRLDNYVTTVVSHFKGKVYAWDVVNEVVDGPGMRNSLWYQIAGEDYIDHAFIAARKADPKAKLFINDYDTTDPVKAETLYQLVKRLKARGVPVDGIGMQFHITLDYPSLQGITDSLNKFSDLGVEFHITELDMSVNADPKLTSGTPSPDVLTRQAWRYKQIFDIFKTFKNVTNVTFWGVTDARSWLRYSPVAKADWPLLFDDNLAPKLAFWGLTDPSRLPPDVTIGPKNSAKTATAPKGTPVIDGLMDDVWKKAPEMPIAIYVLGNGAHGVGKALWDDTNLYVFVSVTDPVLSNKSQDAYQQDSVEIFVDEKNNKSTTYADDDAQYRFSFQNLFSSSGGNPAKSTSVAMVTKTGYDVEVAIPWRFVKPASGVAIGFDLQINDDDGSGSRTSYAKWNDPTNESFRNTSGFGTLVLGN